MAGVFVSVSGAAAEPGAAAIVSGSPGQLPALPLGARLSPLSSRFLPSFAVLARVCLSCLGALTKRR